MNIYRIMINDKAHQWAIYKMNGLRRRHMTALRMNDSIILYERHHHLIDIIWSTASTFVDLVGIYAMTLYVSLFP